MTNRELLTTPKEVLSEVDKQRLFLLRTEETPVPCPACKRQVNVFDAAAIDLDAYDFGRTGYEFRCPGCGAELEQVVPAFPGGGHFWHWQLKTSWLQQQPAKGKAIDAHQTEPQAEEPHA